MSEGGTFGTEGYCPPDLAAAAAEGDGSAAPYSDRYGRDMLLVELLFMDGGLSPDDPAVGLERRISSRRYAAWHGPWRYQLLAGFAAFGPGDPLHADGNRSARLGRTRRRSRSALHTKPLLRRMTRVWSSTPAVLGHPLSALPLQRLSRPSTLNGLRPATAALNFIVPWRWRRPESYPGYTTLWQEIKVAMGCASILLMPAIMALIILLLKAVFDLLGMPFRR